MPCKTQANLILRWATATRELSESTAALTEAVVAEMTQTEYYGLMAKAEQARLSAENIGLTLELHRREHGC